MTNTTGTHLTDGELNALLDGALRGEALYRADQHVQACDACRDALAALTAQEASLRTALSDEPGEAYFATFADRVVGRIARAEAEGVSSERAADEVDRVPRFVPWWQRPRTLAMAGSVAAVVVVAGMVLMMAREAPLPLSARRSEVAEQAPATPPAVDKDTKETSLADDAARRPNAAPPSAKPRTDARPPAERKAEARAPKVATTAMREVPRGSIDRRATAPRTLGAPAPARPTEKKLTTAERLRFAKRPAPAADQIAAQQAPATGAAAGAPTRSLATSRRAAGTSAAAPEAARREADGWVSRCGVVRDETGHALAGASVTAVTARRSSTTAADGSFCIELPPGDHVIEVLASGYRPMRLDVDADAPLEPLVASLTPASANLAMRGGAARGGRATEPRAFATAPQDEAGPTALATLSGGDAALRVLPASLRPLADAASKAQANAPSIDGPNGWDIAADLWLRLVPRVAGSPAEAEVRGRVAECRYFAWRKSRDARHASRAVEALTAFIGRVPVGDRQTLATRWIDQIRAR